MQEKIEGYDFIDRADDVVYLPPYYSRCKVEPIIFIMKNEMEYWRGAIIKHVSRAGFKPYPGCDEKESEIKDLMKAARYIEMRLNDLRGKDIL